MRGVSAGFKRRGLVIGVAVLVLAAAACSSSDEDGLAEAPTSSSATTSTTATTTPAPPTTEPDTSDEDPEVAAIKQVWTEFVRTGADRSDPTRIAELSLNDEVAASADDQFFDPRDAQSFYTQVTIDGETATIEDCSLFSKPLSLFHYIPIEGAAELVDGEWRISDLEVNNIERCIPGDVAAEILGVYEAFWDAEDTYGDPPDLDNPLIEDTLTGRRLERKIEILEWQIANNAAWRSRPVTNPRFIDFLPGLFVIQDCQNPSPDKGYYDLDTGQRIADSEEVVTGQTDLVSTRIEFAETRWKIEFVGADRNVDCEVNTVEPIDIVGPIEEST